MGRGRSAANFIHAIEGREAPLNTPGQALALMKMIDAAYESSRSGKPVAIG
jgi:predicted dehydrogenase